MSQSFTAETWEPVCGGTAGDTWRMRVAGGWIYRYDTWTQDGNGKVSTRLSPKRQLHARTDAESLVWGRLTSPEKTQAFSVSPLSWSANVERIRRADLSTLPRHAISGNHNVAVIQEVAAANMF